MRKPRQSEYFDLKALRALYGRSREGENRQNIKITITPSTIAMLQQALPLGKGKYGSATFELGLRLVLALATEGEEVETVTEELFKAVDSPYLLNNCRSLASVMEKLEFAAISRS